MWHEYTAEGTRVAETRRKDVKTSTLRRATGEKLKSKTRRTLDESFLL